MICRTVEDAYAAGLNAKCTHGQRYAACEHCRLTTTEIASLAALLRGGPVEAAAQKAA